MKIAILKSIIYLFIFSVRYKSFSFQDMDLIQQIFYTRFDCTQENGDVGDDGLHRGVQYPFSVNEKVVIQVMFFSF